MSAIISILCLTPTGHLAAMQCPTPVFSLCSLARLPLPPPLSSLCWLAPVQCRPVRASSEETGVPHEPKTIRSSTGWAPVGRLNIQPCPTLGRPQPVARHLPRVPALISWCVCTPGSSRVILHMCHPSPWPSPTAPTTPPNLPSF